MFHLFPVLRPRVRYSAHAGLYAYHQGTVLLPGADSQVFEPTFTLPLQAVNGRATFAGSPPAALQGPQVFAYNNKGISGIGGLTVGGILSPGPLSDNDGE